jgi:hypothetical protein
MKTKSFLSEWRDKYRQIFEKGRIVSQISTFLVVFISFHSLWYFLLGFFQSEIDLISPIWNDVEYRNDVVIAIVFHLLIGLSFSIRFVLLFFKKHKFVWFSQASWVIGITAIYAYMWLTRGGFPSNDHCMDCVYISTFRHASPSFTGIALSYFIFSTLKQVLALSFSAFSALSNRYRTFV